MRDEDDGDYFGNVVVLADVVLHTPGGRRYALRNESVAPARVVQRLSIAAGITLAKRDALLLPGLGTDVLQYLDGDSQYFGD